MEKICPNCNTEIPDSSTVCPQCGFVFNKSLQPPKKKAKWWMIAIPAILVVVILVVTLWTPLYIRLMPEAAIASAAASTGMELAKRYKDSPYSVLFAPRNQAEAYTLSIAADNYDSTGTACDLSLAIDGLERTLRTEITVSTEGECLDVSLYVDPGCAAIGSSQLLGDTYYGITYETFSQDLRGNQLMNAILDEETMAAAEDFVQSLANAMQPPAGSASDETTIAVLYDFISQLDAEVSRGKISLDDREYSCNIVSYTVTGFQAAELLQQVAGSYDPDTIRALAVALRENVTDCDISFLIRKDRLAGVDVTINGLEDGAPAIYQLGLNFGANAAADGIQLSFARLSGSQKDAVQCLLTMSRENGGYSESLDVSACAHDGSKTDYRVCYAWDMESGDLGLDILSDDSTNSLYMNLKEVDNGFSLALNRIYESADESSDLNNNSDISFQMTLISGAAIQKPEFCNLDSWSISDLYQFIGILS